MAAAAATILDKKRREEQTYSPVKEGRSPETTAHHENIGATLGKHRNKKVLLAVDSSEGSRRAERWAAEWLINPGDLVVLLYVQKKAEAGALFSKTTAQYGISERSLDDQEDFFYSELPSLAGSFDKAGARTEIRVTQGDPGKAICNAAAAEQPCCVVLGSRHRSQLKGLMLGSVTDYVMHHSPVPVTVVRQPEEH